MRRWDVGGIGTCRLGCIVRRKLRCQVGESRCRRCSRRRKSFYGANMSIFGLSCRRRVNGDGLKVGVDETTHCRGGFIGLKSIQVKVLDEVCDRRREGHVSAGRKKQRVGDILPLRATDVVA